MDITTNRSERAATERSSTASTSSTRRSSASSDKEARIVQAALSLAEEGGFEAVRQRDVAARAGVALGTLYKRFSSKGELLLGLMDHVMQSFEETSQLDPPAGSTPLERTTTMFRRATDYLLGKPKVARAIIRGVAGSYSVVSERNMRYQKRIMQLVLVALLGREIGSPPPANPEADGLTENEAFTVATMLLQVWFAALVGWSGGGIAVDAVVQHVRTAAELALLGLKAQREQQ